MREEYRLRVFENRVLKRIFGPKRNEVIWEWRRLHNKEVYALYSSRNIVRAIKSRRLKLAGYVARVREMRGVYIFWSGNLRKRDHLEHRGVDGRIILKWVFEKSKEGMDWIDLAQDRYKWRAFVIAVMTLRVPQNSGNFMII
jgi:hypothetical protein